MKKELVIAGASVVVILVGAFVYMGQIENKIESAIREKIAQTPISVENISYNALSSTLHLNKVFLEVNEGNKKIILNASDISFSGFNTDFFESEEKIPMIFDNFSAKNFNVDYRSKSEHGFVTNIDSISIDNYAHNIAKVMNQYETNIFSEEFFEAVFNYNHAGIEVEGYKLIVQQGNEITPMRVNAGKIVVDEVENPYFVSINYKDLEIINESMNFKTAVLNVDDWQIPNAKKLATAAQALLDFSGITQENIDQYPFPYDEFLINIYRDFSYKYSTHFSNIFLEEMKLSVHDDLLENVKNKEILMESLNIDLEIDLKFDETASIEYDVENLVINSDYAELFERFEGDISQIIKAFITDDIVINLSAKNVADLRNKTATFENEASFSQMFETSGSATVQYEDDDIINMLFFGMSEYAASSIKYNSMKSSYTDKGFIPLITNVAAVNMGMPLDPLLESAKKELTIATNQLSMNENADALLAEIVDGALAMLEKPGSLEVEIDFNTPYSFEDILIDIPTDFEYEVSVDQGNKTIRELTPKALFKK